MEVLVGKSSINGPCSIAMLNYQRVNMQTSSHLTVAESLRFNRTASGLRSMTLALHISFVTLEGSKLSQVNHGKSMWIICRKKRILLRDFLHRIVHGFDFRGFTEKPLRRRSKEQSVAPFYHPFQGHKGRCLRRRSLRIPFAPGLKINELTIKSCWDIDVKFTSEPFMKILQSLCRIRFFEKFTGGLGMNKLTGMKHSRALTCWSAQG